MTVTTLPSTPLANTPKAVEVTMASGVIAVYYPWEIRERLAGGLPDNGICPVCDRHTQRSGWGPHADSHRRQIGDLPPRPARPRKAKRTPKPKAEKVTPPPTIEESCLALIYAYAGDKVPVGMIGDINFWIDKTKQLIEALK